VSELQESRLEQIAQRLTGDGVVDNEADARLAALRILLADDVRRSWDVALASREGERGRRRLHE